MLCSFLMFSLFLFNLRLSCRLLLIRKKLDELSTPLCIVTVSGYHRQPSHDDGDDDDDDGGGGGVGGGGGGGGGDDDDEDDDDDGDDIRHFTCRQIQMMR